MSRGESVLVVGGGGREHAIVKALLRTHAPLTLYAHPGNPGMVRDGCNAVPSPISSWSDLAQWAAGEKIDLTVVGPEVPLVEGIADSFQERGLAVFGPSRKAARIEGSKAFAKDLMKKYGIPTAAYKTVKSREDALLYLQRHGAPIVVKVSGLAAGKGAILCMTSDEAQRALDDIFVQRTFGEAGTTVVLEEMMSGEEASVFVLTDGLSHLILPVSQDHKRIGDGDTGPNTGGMGAYAPAPLVDAALLARIDREVIVPTLDAMRREGCPYQGLLYAGIMITAHGPKVVEFNCRFGDPETQAVLPLLGGDLYRALEACATGRLDSVDLRTRPQSCVSVVLAAGGYPGPYEKGKIITGIDEVTARYQNVDVYHAGTMLGKNGELLTMGGRVLAVSAWADSLNEAIRRAYDATSGIDFQGKTMRSDIGAKGLARLEKGNS